VAGAQATGGSEPAEPVVADPVALRPDAARQRGLGEPRTAAFGVGDDAPGRLDELTVAAWPRPLRRGGWPTVPLPAGVAASGNPVRSGACPADGRSD